MRCDAFGVGVRKKASTPVAEASGTIDEGSGTGGVQEAVVDAVGVNIVAHDLSAVVPAAFSS